MNNIIVVQKVWLLVKILTNYLLQLTKPMHCIFVDDKTVQASLCHQQVKCINLFTFPEIYHIQFTSLNTNLYTYTLTTIGLVGKFVTKIMVYGLGGSYYIGILRSPNRGQVMEMIE